ncbi:polysaccharide pyruvyl transferase family protein [Alphaproteobacteria bacterium]|nr:polysaccharide pyruvyl transferase family protein [Alphaproteobacteria bacterium]
MQIETIHPFIPLIEKPFLQIFDFQSRGYEIVFVPNPGNTGDGLILFATLQLFRKFKIKFRYYSSQLEFKNSKKIIVYCGGGGIKKIYPNILRKIRLLSSQKIPLIILPSSLDECSPLLDSFHEMVFVWAREEKTYKYLNEKSDKKFNCGISHDVALALDMEDNHLSTFTELIPLNKKIASFGLSLKAHRNDKEASLKTFSHKESHDLSQLTEPKWPNKAFSFESINYLALCLQVSQFLNYLSLFEKIETDRMHVAIASILLNKEIELFDNSDKKISSVYDHSLKFLSSKIKINW